ncbi:hypothetical protein GPECTOR_280g740 [Gonium pectorale]|uniref:MYB transcription factor n=1 Tax=Gonium pectorale TaxID=33097 RepID=A0A150FW52_GONPE|nr:hypothetical protein GPECTOR_280g740 [Gonium pectorale]|eukprot:KXZ41798.1 hypothetical protein GPECTOR_280g740 [Gonium pectorale]
MVHIAGGGGGGAAAGEQLLGGRTPKQCRDRWMHYLKPDVITTKQTWSEQEEWALVAAHAALGNRWADIARRVGGRSENAVKNHWNTGLRRKLPTRYADMRISVLDRYQALRGFKKFPPPEEAEVLAAATSGPPLPTPSGGDARAGGRRGGDGAQAGKKRKAESQNEQAQQVPEQGPPQADGRGGAGDSLEAAEAAEDATAVSAGASEEEAEAYMMDFFA